MPTCMCRWLVSKNRRSITALFFFFNDTATTEIYTLSLHDALPILSERRRPERPLGKCEVGMVEQVEKLPTSHFPRSEEHTSELQSPDHLVCRLLLEKKKSCIRAPCSRASATPRTPRKIRRPFTKKI